MTIWLMFRIQSWLNYTPSLTCDYECYQCGHKTNSRIIFQVHIDTRRYLWWMDPMWPFVAWFYFDNDYMCVVLHLYVITCVAWNCLLPIIMCGLMLVCITMCFLKLFIYLKVLSQKKTNPWSCACISWHVLLEIIYFLIN